MSIIHADSIESLRSLYVSSEVTSFPSTYQMREWISQWEIAWLERLVWIIPLIIVLALFDLVLKVMAARKAGNHKQLGWFICLLVFNTCGILPIVYLLCFQKEKSK